MKTYKLEKYGNTYEIALVKSNYQNGGALYVGMWVVENGELVEPWNDLTVNVPMSGAHDNLTLIDTNNNGKDIMKWLKDNKLGTETMFSASSGYCVYPLFLFKKKVVEEMIPME